MPSKTTATCRRCDWRADEPDAKGRTVDEQAASHHSTKHHPVVTETVSTTN